MYRKKKKRANETTHRETKFDKEHITSKKYDAQHKHDGGGTQTKAKREVVEEITKANTTHTHIWEIFSAKETNGKLR